MTRFAIIAAVLLCSIVSKAQWLPADRMLKLPRSPSGIYSSIGSLKKYDTIRCVYKDRLTMGLGYKIVLVRHGFYVDNPRTFRVFLDENKKRVRIKVDSFAIIPVNVTQQ